MESFRFKRSFKKALLWAAMAVILIYRNRGSIAYPIFMAGTLAILASDCKAMGKSLIRDINGRLDIKLFYVISLMLLAILKCITSSDQILLFSGIGILILFISLLLKIYTGKEDNEITGQLLKMLQVLVTPFKHIGRPFSDLSAVRKTGQPAESSGSRKNVRSVLLGLLIAIPLLVVIIALLSSADMIFGDIVGDVLDSIKLPELDEDWIGVPFKFFVSFIAFYAWSACLPAEIFPDNTEPRRFDAVIAITFNSLIALVYLIFSGIQFIYLVGRMELPGGYTYAEYAHEGFYQLLAVTILSLILVSFCKKHFEENHILKFILVIINLCTFVMIASASLRMFLYVGVYGLSRLRVDVLWLLVVLSVWTLILTIGIFRKNLPYFRLIMVFSTVWFLIFGYSMPDRWIASYDLKLDEPPTDLVYEVYLDAADIIYEDGRYWDKYCRYLHSDQCIYEEKNPISFIREYNFMEDAGMRLIRNCGEDD
jgi:hypothetical protein